MIDDAVSSAAAARSSALPETDFTDAVICISDADVSSIAVVTLSASRLTLRIDDDISVMEVVTSSAAVAISRAVPVTL